MDSSIEVYDYKIIAPWFLNYKYLKRVWYANMRYVQSVHRICGKCKGLKNGAMKYCNNIRD